MSRGLMQYKITEIEKDHGRITKSIFTISNWIMDTKRYENISRKLGNKGTLNYIWEHRGLAVKEMLKTGLFEIKIHKPGDNKCLWLYVLHINRNGVEVNLCVPYPMYKKIINIHHSELELSKCNADSITINGNLVNYNKKFKLGFVIDNIDKSRIKLIEKMNGK